MTGNHAELCERLISDIGKAILGEGTESLALVLSRCAALLQSQAARIQQQALEYVSLQAQCDEHLARIAELEKERDSLKADAERYEYLLDCDVEAARRYLPSLDADEFKNVRRARHSVALQAEKETRS